MKALEVIHLRLAGVDPKDLADSIRAGIDSPSDQAELRIFRHGTLETDLLVHLYRDTDERSDQASSLGEQLASVLRPHGMVEHSVWVEVPGPHEASISTELHGNQ